ncbi:MAG TPA: hypothetical protein VF541_05470 [Longimicrobium sp.]|jgi:hypothetical protein
MSAAATKAEAERRARAIVDRWAKTGLFTGWIPGAAIALGGVDMLMIRQVGEAFAIPAFDEDALKAHLGGVLGSVAGGVAAEALNFIPVIGWAAKSVTMYVKADALGKAVIDYFRQRSPLPD